MIACWLVKIAHFVFYFAQWSRNRPFQMKKYSDQTTEVRRRKTDQHSGKEADQQEKKKLCVCASAIIIPCLMIGSAVVIKQTTRNLFHGHHRPTEVDGDWSKKNFTSLSINRCKFILVSRAPNSLPVLNGSLSCYFFFWFDWELYISLCCFTFHRTSKLVEKIELQQSCKWGNNYT